MINSYYLTMINNLILIFEPPDCSLQRHFPLKGNRPPRLFQVWGRKCIRMIPGAFGPRKQNKLKQNRVIKDH